MGATPVGRSAAPALHFVLPGVLKSVREARFRFLGFATAQRALSCHLDGIELALGEAVANAVRHGSAGHPESIISVRCQLHPDRFEITVADRGPGFDPAAVPAPVLFDGMDLEDLDIDAIPTSGRGLHLMRECMDDVSFSFPDGAGGGGTVCTMTKRLASNDHTTQ